MDKASTKLVLPIPGLPSRRIGLVICKALEIIYLKYHQINNFCIWYLKIFLIFSLIVCDLKEYLDFLG